MKGVDMPFSCFSKEVQEYTRACEHLIGESMRRNNHFSEQEMEMVNYYTDEVVRLVTGKHSSSEFQKLTK
jgi:hypothetical protein